jgi:hypothetical protein
VTPSSKLSWVHFHPHPTWPPFLLWCNAWRCRSSKTLSSRLELIKVWMMD